MSVLTSGTMAVTGAPLSIAPMFVAADKLEAPYAPLTGDCQMIDVG